MPKISPTRRGYLLAAILSFLVAILIVSPFFRLGNASGHDFEFHVASWLEVSNQWHQGILLPRWAEWPNHGFGEPRFLFYPPLSWLLAPLLSFVVPWNWVPVAFIVLIQTFAGVSAFALARRLAPVSSSIAPLVAAACYAANPNALLIIYMRSDFAELLASAFFPLLLLTALKLTDQLPPPEGASSSYARVGITFAALFAGVWLSNAPAAVMATYASTLLFLWTAFTEKSWSQLFRGAASMILGFGLTSFYLIPAAYEQRWVNISQVLSSGLLPSQNFLYTSIEDPEHNFFNWMASTTAIVMIVLTGLAALAVLRSRYNSLDRESAPGSTKTIYAFLILAAAATLMMLRPTSLLWEFLPKLRFVQFPWRWMSTLAVPFACFLGAATASRSLPLITVNHKPRLIAALWIMPTAVMLVGSAIFFVRHTWWDPDDVPTLQSALTSGQGFEGTDEYDPIGDDHYNLPPKVPPQAVLLTPADSPGTTSVALPASPVILRWTAEDKLVRLDTPTPARLALRLLNYPAWHIDLNGTVARPLPAAENNQMILEVPAGRSLVHITFTRTGDRIAGGILTLASALVGLALLTKKLATPH
jgi:uncharacterized membrane protein